MRLLACVAAAAAACTGSTSGTTTFTLTVNATPTLIAYRDGAGPWREPDPGTYAGDYVMHVSADYEVLVVCSDGTGFLSELRRRTVDDADSDLMYCDGHSYALPGSVAVNGRMLQAGMVAMGDYASSPTAPWDYALAVVPAPTICGRSTATRSSSAAT